MTFFSQKVFIHFAREEILTYFRLMIKQNLENDWWLWQTQLSSSLQMSKHLCATEKTGSIPDVLAWLFILKQKLKKKKKKPHTLLKIILVNKSVVTNLDNTLQGRWCLHTQTKLKKNESIKIKLFHKLYFSIMYICRNKQCTDEHSWNKLCK